MKERMKNDSTIVTPTVTIPSPAVSRPVPPLEHHAIARGYEVLLREEAPQGVGESDVTEGDEEGWGKTFLALLEPLPERETAAHNMCQALL